MTTEPSVVAQLLEVTKYKIPDSADVQTMLQALAKKADDLPDEKWRELTETVQVWVNSAVDAMLEKEEVPEPTGLELLQSKPAATPKKATPPAKAKAPGKKKPAPPKAASAGESQGGTRGPKGKFKDGAVITIVKEKPFREGSKCAEWFSKMKTGQTIPDAIEAGAPRHHIRWAHKLGHIKIAAPAKKSAERNAA